MNKIRTKYLLIGGAVVLGFIGGFLYWRFIGCKSSTCPITSNWHMSTLMGGIIGYLAGDSINDFRTKKKKA